MHSSAISLLCLGVSLIWQVAEATSNGLSLPVRKVTKHKHRALQRRQSDVTNVPVEYQEDWGLLVNVEVGTPGQPMQLYLALEYADTYLLSSDLPICKNDGCTYGTYDPLTSNTFQNETSYPAFNYTWAFSVLTTGYYFTDTVMLEGLTIDNVTMALATALSDFPLGQLGLGPPEAEESVYAGGPTFPPLLTALKAAGHINSTSYSLWFDQTNTDIGTLLLGGIDTDAYQGNLQVHDMLIDPQAGKVDWLSIYLYSVRAWRNGSSIDTEVDYYGIQSSISTGDYYTYLPASMTGPIYAAFNVSVNKTNGPIVDCSLGNANISTYLYFDFNAPDTVDANGFEIPISAFLEPITLDNGTAVTFPENGSQICYFTIQESTTNYGVWLGYTMMRYLYLVVDYETQQVGLAKPVSLENGRNPVIIPAEGAIPTCVGFGCPSTTTTVLPSSSGASAATTASKPATVTVTPTPSHPPIASTVTVTASTTTSSSPARANTAQGLLREPAGVVGLAMAVFALL